MTMPTLYEINKTYLEALEVLTDPDNDFDPEMVANTLTGIEDRWQEKAIQVAMFFRNLETTVQAIKDAEVRMEKRRKSIEARIRWFNSYLKTHMESSGFTKIESPWFVLSIEKNPPALEIFDEAAIPAEYKQETVTITMDNAALKAALKDKKLVPGARLTQKTRLAIR